MFYNFQNYLYDKFEVDVLGHWMSLNIEFEAFMMYI